MTPAVARGLDTAAAVHGASPIRRGLRCRADKTALPQFGYHRVHGSGSGSGLILFWFLGSAPSGFRLGSSPWLGCADYREGGLSVQLRLIIGQAARVHLLEDPAPVRLDQQHVEQTCRGSPRAGATCADLPGEQLNNRGDASPGYRIGGCGPVGGLALPDAVRRLLDNRRHRSQLDTRRSRKRISSSWEYGRPQLDCVSDPGQFVVRESGDRVAACCWIRVTDRIATRPTLERKPQPCSWRAVCARANR